MKLAGLLIISIITLVSCNYQSGVYERMAYFPKHEWSSNRVDSFRFEVTDSTAMYRMYLVLRLRNAYRWKNIWLNIGLNGPDTSYLLRREFMLADNEKWFGRTVDDVVDQRIPFEKTNTPVPLKPGIYTFTLQHVMREDPLQYVLNAGIRVEKVE